MLSVSGHDTFRAVECEWRASPSPLILRETTPVFDLSVPGGSATPFDGGSELNPTAEG